ncbi:MAG: electron transport complex subunit RsxC [Anaeromicrobium sp.]|jgi:electron transport complex protein RnfC|uniref:electron transport complex subunit RsxC n=1 Tax=Anaeromicrobium sp. TaxID=1929132 RepID=UPI0025F26D80|nr:electron transport complex subunit RsxC [Anaeromicrobium sp.]MCT4594936.1 electron transport complex subunit RsxC [Anaeromicrobium sp.]
MKLLSFRGGVHPPHRKKATEKLAVIKANEPKVVYIPLQQHIGAPCEALVKVGDEVKVGQKIGEAKAFVSAPIHSSVSGKVKKVGKMKTPTGEATCIVIESDGLNTVHESVLPKGDIKDLSGKEILEIIKDAGIVGLGGAAFPTHVKFSPPPEKTIDTIILNGAECEPYLTADHRLMLEDPESIVYGLKAMMKIVNVKKAYIGIEDNKRDAIEKMLECAKNEEGISIVSLKTKYPQGAEKQLIYACTQKEVPSGGLPMDVGVIVNNVGTAAAVATVIKTGMPLIERIATITGSGIKEPKNLLIKVGTLFSEIVEQCGGYNGTPGKVIMGGPMMGLAQHTDQVPAIKGTSGILVLSPEEARLPKPEQCIKCGKCVEICPAFLQPVYISAYGLKDMYDKAEEYRALDCIECGSCSFICPSKRPLLHSIRVAKKEIIAKKKKSK